MKPEKVVLLFGPTACGKTSLVESVFSTGFEVVNADSMQVYKGMGIGTAKPGKDLLSRIPHHLIDICRPDEQYTVSDFVGAADGCCGEIAERGNVPLVSGGTAFYIKHFLFGLPETPPSHEGIRRDLEKKAETSGLSVLYNELETLDPESANLIHPNDAYRIIRALEVYQASGRTRSSFEIPRKVRSGYDFLALGLKRTRAQLYERINKRVGQMFEQGLEAEVLSLVNAGYQPTDPGMRGIGYREFFQTDTSGEYVLEQVKLQIMKNSRRYAKRQITFFKSLPDVLWVSPENSSGISEAVSRFLED